MQALSPFANGVALGNADALLLRPGSWRVFLFLSSGPRSFDVASSSADKAIAEAWSRLRAEREAQ